MLKKIHSTLVPAGKLPSFKEKILKGVRRTKDVLPEELGEKIVNMTEAIPEDDHMLHGDYHTKNIVLSGGEVLVIDMDTLSVGHPIFDLMRMYNAYIGYSENDPDVILKFQGFSQDVADRFWHDSLALYLGTKDETKIKKVEDKVRCLAYGYLIDWGTRHHSDAALVSLWKERLIDLLPHVDDLTFEAVPDDGGDPNELVIKATADNLENVLDFIGSHLEAADCPMKSKMQLDLAVEEIFINIANYAYAPEIGKATVRVEVSNDPVAVTITFVDRGVPYDPLKKEDPDVTLSAEDRQIGGLGIFLTKKIMDDVSYEYKDGQNVLMLKKTL